MYPQPKSSSSVFATKQSFVGTVYVFSASGSSCRCDSDIEGHNLTLLKYTGFSFLTERMMRMLQQQKIAK